jgi:ABC-type methionine transport system ATPase subunit
MSLLDQVGVAEHAHKLPSAVSGGQQQRVAIARALANDPPIIIADEPTGNLDSKTAEAVFKLFDGLVAQNKTVLMVTHDRDLAERVSRTLILSDGEIIEEYLARTFPALTEAQLVQATRGVEAQRYAPGTIILEEGAQPDRLYVITKGQVDVVLNGNSGQEIVSTTLNSGQYFGEIELLRGGRNIATIRAGHQSGAEVAALNQAVFDSLLAEATSLREELYRTVSLRVAENQANRRRTYRA